MKADSLFLQKDAKSRLKALPETLRMEVMALENELAEQERCHAEQISALENERRVATKEQEGIREEYIEKLLQLQKE